MVFNQSPLLHFQKSIPEKQKKPQKLYFQAFKTFHPAGGGT